MWHLWSVWKREKCSNGGQFTPLARALRGSVWPPRWIVTMPRARCQGAESRFRDHFPRYENENHWSIRFNKQRLRNWKHVGYYCICAYSWHGFETCFLGISLSSLEVPPFFCFIQPSVVSRSAHLSQPIWNSRILTNTTYDLRALAGALQRHGHKSVSFVEPILIDQQEIFTPKQVIGNPTPSKKTWGTKAMKINLNHPKSRGEEKSTPTNYVKLSSPAVFLLVSFLDCNGMQRPGDIGRWILGFGW